MLLKFVQNEDNMAGYSTDVGLLYEKFHNNFSTSGHQCQQLVQKRPSMCYYVCVIIALGKIKINNTIAAT